MTLSPDADIPADLWSRFAKLSQQCVIDVTSEARYEPVTGVQRAWRVVVHPPSSVPPDTAPVAVYGTSSAAAIAEAVHAAENRGWATSSLAPEPN